MVLTEPSIGIRFFLVSVSLALVAYTLNAAWRGGTFVQLVLVLTAVLQLLELAWAIRNRGSPRTAADPTSPGEELKWRDVAAFIWLSTLLFALIFVFGIYLGITLYAWVILRIISQSSWAFTIMYGLITGVFVPALATFFLDMRLWPGVIPTVVPGWVGGGIVPPI